MLGSKWKVVGLLLWLAFRLAVRHPLPFAVVMVREVIECRVGPAAPERGPDGTERGADQPG